MISSKINGGQIYWKRKSWGRELFWKYDECAICKTKEELEVHHIIKTDKTNELYYDLNNGVLLCHRCLEPPRPKRAGIPGFFFT